LDGLGTANNGAGEHRPIAGILRADVKGKADLGVVADVL
jgi:hypothetical protein